jgi:uncharacterized protein YbjT (DUF2867 family)
MKHVVLAGATGMVGQSLVRLLDSRSDVAFTALVRRAGRMRGISGRVIEEVFDYDDPTSYLRLGNTIPCDILLCTLGTTIKTAGSAEAFRKVDHDYPVALMNRLAELEPKPLFGAVSSVGADHPRGLYLQTKADMEKDLIASDLPYVIFRPGLLLGERREPRMVEVIVSALVGRPYLALARIFTPQSRLVWKYAPMEATELAKVMERTCVDDPPALANRVLSGLALHHPILGID